MTETQPVADLLRTWGLPLGRSIQGWSFRTLSRTHAGDGATLLFASDAGEIEVRVELSSGRPHLVRVGELDVSHGRTEAPLESAALRLTRGFAKFLADHENGRALRAELLVQRDSKPEPEKPPVEPAKVQGEAYAVSADAPPLDPSKRTDPSRPFMQFDTIELDELERFPDALRQMYLGKLGGLIVKGVYSKPAMARIVKSLEESSGDFPLTSFPAKFRAHFYGRCLDGSDPELGEYLADAERFREQTLALFPPDPPFEARIEEVCRRMSGGRRVELARFRDGRPYTPATIRILLENGQIGTHCGNEASTRPAYTHLNTLIDRGDQISYFLTLQEPEVGGELIVYSLKWSDIDESRIVGGRSQVEDLLAEAEWLAASPTAGDLLVFDGGRYFHRVDFVRGPRTRWTMGGFMMFDAAGERLLYWS